MKNVIGVINLGKEQSMLQELTGSRSIASVPFGGRYRLIDFVLSNMVNAGAQKVAVFTLNKSRSLLDHLGSGKEWDLDRKRGGLFILPPAINYPSGEYKGDLQNFYGHLDYFQRSKEKYVIIARSHVIYNMDFNKLLEAHEESKADITLVYKDVDQSEVCPEANIKLKLGPDAKVTDVHQGLLETGRCNLFMETFIIERTLLIEMILDSVEKNQYDLLTQVVMNNLDRLVVKGYQHQGYLSMIHNVASYYRHSMSLLNPEVWHNLFYEPGLIYTKIKDEPPTRYSEQANVRGSLIANGCEIEGTVENSILFRGVKVAKGTHIKNSIVMQKCEIEEGVDLDHVIIDKEVKVTEGKVLAGDPANPLVINKRSWI